MKKILLLTAFLFVSFMSLGQCPINPITLSTQAELDAFATDFPDCSVLNQNLTITEGDITSLAGLSQLTQINAELLIQSDGLSNLTGLQNIGFIDYLNIDQCTGLSSLTGLDGLVQMRALRIFECDGLTDLTGLNNVSIVSESINLDRNRNLISLDGFQNITMDAPEASLRFYLNFDLESLGNFIQSVAGQVNIDFSQNLSLVNLQGLEVVTRTKDLSINNSAQGLSGLENIEQVDGALRIWGNSSSSFVSLQPLQGLTMTGADATQANLIGSNFHLSNIDGLFATNTTLTNGMSLISNDNLQSMDFMLDVVAMEGQLTIWQMDQFENLAAFQNITGNLTAINIILMDNLTNLDALSGITGISEFIFINNNERLENLDGLSNIVLNSSIFNDGTQRLYLKVNNSLTDISGISGLDLASNNDNIELEIEGNPLLAICDYINICDLLENSGNAEISIINNAPGCANEVEVAEACGFLINTVQGQVRYDFNADGCDPADNGAPRLQIEVNDGTESFIVITDNQGDYAKALFTEGNFTTSIVGASLPDFFEATPASQDSNFIGFGNEDVIDFCLTATETINDLKIALIPTTQAAPGFNSYYDLVYENVGTTQLSGQVTLLFEEIKQNFVEATPSQTSIAGGLVTWDYVDLNPFETRIIKVTLNNYPPPTNEIGDELPLQARVFPITDDANSTDNTSEFKQIVVGAFDPNDKNVVQGAEISEAQVGAYLDYVVRFQNTGNSNATTVIIEDLLDVNLQWESLRPLSASHSYRTEIRNGNEVSFIFENIDLPPEMTDPEGSQGYIAFQVRTDDSLIVGDEIDNTASIFFDFNPAIVTNTVNTIVVDVEPPIAVCQSIMVSLDATGQAVITAADIDNGSSDTNGIATLELDITTFDCSNVGENTVTLTVTDTYGNISECTAIVTIIDDLAPILACQSIVVSLDVNGMAIIDSMLLLDMTNTSDNCGIETVGSSVTMVDCTAIDTPVEVTVFVEDINGNIATCNTTISAIDEFPPVFDTTTLPVDQTKMTDESGVYLLKDFTTSILAEDNCTAAVTLAQSPNVATSLVPGVYDITISATDAFSNETEYSFELTVELLLGLNDFSIENKIILYPNPVSDILQIKTSLGVELKEVTIYSIQGKKLLVTSDLSSGTSSEREEKINLSSLSQGVYFVIIRTKEGNFTKKIVKN